jgi:ubiquinone biosynthesis protein UbiJ
VTDKNSINDLLLKPAQLLLDRGREQSTTAAALCARLEGKSLLVDPGSAGLTMHLIVRDGRLSIESGAIEAPDARLQGSPLSLARMASEDPEQAIRSGRVQMSGDADVAADYQALLEVIRPDWEELLSRLTGDVVAHEAGRFVGGVMGWAKGARHTLGRSLAEYLTEESRDLAATAEIEEFCAGVDQVSAGVDRAEARLKQLRASIKLAQQTAGQTSPDSQPASTPVKQTK